MKHLAIILFTLLATTAHAFEERNIEESCAQVAMKVTHKTRTDMVDLSLIGTARMIHIIHSKYIRDSYKSNHIINVAYVAKKEAFYVFDCNVLAGGTLTIIPLSAYELYTQEAQENKKVSDIVNALLD
jgi:hypothetical protein|tara:strand:+ start:410 stop:793 length:384 start_codon:yes stop_codon:yes gene_type:complete